MNAHARYRFTNPCSFETRLAGCSLRGRHQAQPGLLQPADMLRRLRAVGALLHILHNLHRQLLQRQAWGGDVLEKRRREGVARLDLQLAARSGGAARLLLSLALQRRHLLDELLGLDLLELGRELLDVLRLQLQQILHSLHAELVKRRPQRWERRTKERIQSLGWHALRQLRLRLRLRLDLRTRASSWN